MGRKKKFSRVEVLDKAIPVFWQHGLAETSVQDLEHATHVNKSGLYAEFESKEDIFVESLRRYFKVLEKRGTLIEKPLGWDNIEAFLYICRGGWGRTGCFSVNSMREFSDLPLQARELMIGSVKRIKRQLADNLSAARGTSKDSNDALAGLVITFFSGLCLEQNLSPSEKEIAKKIAQFMQLIRAM